MSQSALFDDEPSTPAAPGKLTKAEAKGPKPGDALKDALDRCETPWQRTVIQEWARRHPDPIGMVMGYLGLVELVARPMGCVQCKTPSVAIPQERGEPAMAGYLICPVCSFEKMQASA